MSRPTRLRMMAGVSVGLAMAVIAATAGAASASPAAGPSRPAFLVQITETSGLNEAGVPGELGSTGTIRATLRPAGRPNAPAVGSVELELIVTSVAYPSSILEVGEIQLTGGTLSIQGVQNEDVDGAPLAVTGGTGRFVGATGTVVVATTTTGDTVLTVNSVRR